VSLTEGAIQSSPGIECARDMKQLFSPAGLGGLCKMVEVSDMYAILLLHNALYLWFGKVRIDTKS
jgi:hypothetical protein